MKSKHVALMLCGILLLGMLLNGCGKQEEKIIPIVIDQKLLNISGNSAKEFIQDIKAVNSCDVTEIEALPKGTVSLSISESQRQEWEQYMKGMLEDHIQFFSNLADGYKIDVSPDYKEVDLYYNLKLDAEQANMAVMTTEYYCAMIQIMEGQTDWYVKLRVYNSDTGKLVAQGDSEKAFSYSETDWIASN